MYSLAVPPTCVSLITAQEAYIVLRKEMNALRRTFKDPGDACSPADMNAKKPASPGKQWSEG